MKNGCSIAGLDNVFMRSYRLSVVAALMLDEFVTIVAPAIRYQSAWFVRNKFDNILDINFIEFFIPV